MKQIFYILTLGLGLLSCTEKAEKKIDNAYISKTEDHILKFHKLEKLFVIGDFDGDQKKDTIFEHNYSQLTKTEIDNSADPFQNEWGTVINWFYEQKPNLYLTINRSNQDTLHLGIAQGLYCLINIGDNNSDGKDEIAFVVDELDFSRVNKCEIYTLCKGSWTQLKQFDIHEGAFNFTDDKPPTFNNIKDFLEKQNGKWVYMDYSLYFDENQDFIGKMMKLKLGKCK